MVQEKFNHRRRPKVPGLKGVEAMMTVLTEAKADVVKSKPLQLHDRQRVTEKARKSARVQSARKNAEGCYCSTQGRKQQ